MDDPESEKEELAQSCIARASRQILLAKSRDSVWGKTHCGRMLGMSLALDQHSTLVQAALDRLRHSERRRRLFS
jgi:hypothetical protein